MFTGFASENTPAIQVWNYFQTSASTSAVRSVSLADDCAPIQYFKTGSNTTVINLYLPTAPIEGKQIKIVNANYTSTNQSINVYSSDTNGAGTTNPFIVIGSGQTLDLCYSKDFIFVNANGQFNTGWISLNQSPIGAYAFNAVVVGGNNNSAVASRAAVLGGSVSVASGQSSAVVGGTSNTASSTAAAVIGGTSNTASGGYSAVLSGSFNTSGGFYSAVSGYSNSANSDYSAVIGGSSGSTKSIRGNLVFPASNEPISPILGVQQLGTLLLGRQTTNATATVLTSNTSAAATTNQVILPNNSAYTFQGTCIANVTGGGTTSGWKFEGVIKRGANAASTALVAAVTPTVIAQDVGAATWVLAVTADTTNGGIAVTVTGAAATTIRWVAKIETTEVTF
jgi:hypothetical protein